MGRAFRRVPPGWQHPIVDGQFVPLLDGCYFLRKVAEREEEIADGEDPAEFPPYNEAEFSPRPPGEGAVPDDWWYALYEVTSDGTPESPPFPTPEELAEWLIAFGGWDDDTVPRLAGQVRRGKA